MSHQRGSLPDLWLMIVGLVMLCGAGFVSIGDELWPVVHSATMPLLGV